MRRFWVFFAFLPLCAAEFIPDRYIVELSSEPVAAVAARQPLIERRAALRGARAQARRASIRGEQQKLRRRIEQQQATVLASVETVANALVVHAPGISAARLARMPGVRHMHPVREFHLLLDHALPLMKVPDAWSVVGIDNAGAGMKIGIIDTGIDITHPGFQDASSQVPSGFPKTNSDDDEALTNSKVIVARSYVNMLRRRDPDPSARDHVGHGTATAMAAAGVQNTGPLATITGVAPKAFLGNYKVFGSPGVNDGASEDAILKAIDDAVSDGMDVISLSLGSNLASAPSDDPEVEAIERASAAGVIVVVAAGNAGPDVETISSPATAPSAITVGASANDRIFSAAVSTSAGGSYLAVPGSGPRPLGDISGPLKDVADLDPTGLACGSLPPDSLKGRVALILRGDCFFEDKLNNAGRAGAIAALVYTDRDRPDPFTMSVGAATLPAEMVSYQNGIEIKRQSSQAVTATLHFTVGPVYSDPDKIAGFSSRGPDLDWSIKPDLVAVGTNVYMATEKDDAKGDMFSLDGYTVDSGTSFSTPMVAGAVALLKAARPGLRAAQYRSLLIDNAAGISLAMGASATVQQAGGGLLDLSAALRATGALAPASISFGTGAGDFQITRSFTLSNAGTAPETFLLSAVSRDGGPVPVLSMDQVQLDPGASVDVRATLAGASLAPKSYEGFILVQGTSSGVESHAPYWYGVTSPTPRFITVVDTRSDLTAGATVNNAIFFRVLDAAGVYLKDVQPEVTATDGGGDVLGVRLRDQVSPGVFSVNVRLGALAGLNVFRIRAGDVTRDVVLISK